VKILVTGGAGFIGSNIADAFIRDGHEVAILDDLSTGFRRNINPRALFFHGDMRDRDFVKRVFDIFQPDVIDHHAAQIDVRKSLVDPGFDAAQNIIGSIGLIQEAVRGGVKKFIYASTGGVVYGEPQWLPTNESHPVHPECAYGISKHTVEHYLELYRILEALPYVVLRYSNVYGPRQNPHGEAGVNAIFVGMMLDGKVPTIFGDGEQLRDYVFIEDVVDANRRALSHDKCDIYNIGSGSGTSVNRLFEILQDVIGLREPAHYAPKRMGEIERIYLDARKAERELGWRAQTTIEEGLAKTVAWFQQQRADTPA
jgi:UDP-glucose 4-epimerase